MSTVARRRHLPPSTPTHRRWSARRPLLHPRRRRRPPRQPPRRQPPTNRRRAVPRPPPTRPNTRALRGISTSPPRVASSNARSSSPRPRSLGVTVSSLARLREWREVVLQSLRWLPIPSRSLPDHLPDFSARAIRAFIGSTGRPRNCRTGSHSPYLEADVPMGSNAESRSPPGSPAWIRSAMDSRCRTVHSS